MSDPVEPLILDLLEWIGPHPRPYAEVLEAWRTSCPRLPVWEEANIRGFIDHLHEQGQVAHVAVSPRGLAQLEAQRARSAAGRRLAGGPAHPTVPSHEQSRRAISAMRAEPPNPSLERTANGMAPWPRGAVVHVAPRGQGAMPSSAAQLKRQAAQAATVFRVGLISDTHGLLRPEAAAFLRGSSHIVHAGDICAEAVLQELAALAPVTAVLGNNDRGPWTSSLRESELVQLGGVYVYVIHDLAALDIDPVAASAQVVVSGHSHKPSVAEREGVLYVNPGSAGPRRFRLPIAAGELLIHEGSVSARITEFSIKNAA